MLVIIDGIDKAGKSFLIENLKNRMPNLLLLKILDKPQDGSAYEKQKIKNHFRKMYHLTQDNPYFVYVMDRWFTSEMVYSFKRNYEAMEDPWYLDFDTMVSKVPHLYVWVKADAELIRQRFIKDNETYARAGEIPLILSRYQKIYNITSMNKMTVDTTDNLEGSVLRIIDKAKRIKGGA